MESQPQNPEFRNNPENCVPCCFVIATNTIYTSKHLFVFKDFFISKYSDIEHNIIFNKQSRFQNVVTDVETFTA